MKLLSNPSPSSGSSTSYTTTNFDDSICSSKPTSAGCIRGVLRRLLCFNSLPTHPSDNFKERGTEFETQDFAKGVDNVEGSGTPGLMARLMGLDSMPITDFGNSQMNLSSVRRSRSMDSLREIELMQGKHRHVKNTLSFRDVPAFLELENEEFFILSFEGGDGNEEVGPKTRKSNLGFSEVKPKNKNGDKNKKRQCVQENDKENQETCQILDKKQLQRKGSHGNSNDPTKALCHIKNCQENSSSIEIVKKINSPIKHSKDTLERGKLSKKKKKENCSPVKKVETDCDSENTSPVSVLDFAEFPLDFEVSTSEQRSRLTSSNSRRTLFEELKSYKSSSSQSNTSRLITDDWEVKRIGDKCAGFWKRSDFKNQSYAEMWGEICKFAETDLKQSKWTYREKWGDEEFEEIISNFGCEILEQLLLEVVDQVSCEIL